MTLEILCDKIIYKKSCFNSRVICKVKVGDEMRTFLFYVRMWYFKPEKKDGLFVLRCTCDNPYRIVGKLYATSIEHIDRVDYALSTPEREKFWADEGYKIKDYKEPKLAYD